MRSFRLSQSAGLKVSYPSPRVAFSASYRFAQPSVRPFSDRYPGNISISGRNLRSSHHRSIMVRKSRRSSCLEGYSFMLPLSYAARASEMVATSFINQTDSLRGGAGCELLEKSCRQCEQRHLTACPQRRLGRQLAAGIAPRANHHARTPDAPMRLQHLVEKLLPQLRIVDFQRHLTAEILIA